MRNSFIPSVQLIEAISKQNFPLKNALDLGCGTGRDTFFLLNNGFTVTAIDKEKSVLEAKMPRFATSKLKSINGHIENIEFEVNSYDLVNAQSVLPFIDERYIEHVLHKIRDCLVENGLFVGQFFGVEDKWASSANLLNFHTKDQVRELLSEFKIVKLIELKKYGFTLRDEPKFWHFHSFIVQR